MRRLALLVATALALMSPPVAANDGDGDLTPPADPPSPTPTINDSSATITVSFREDLQVVSSQTGRPGRQAECGFFDVTGRTIAAPVAKRQTSPRHGRSD